MAPLAPAVTELFGPLQRLIADPRVTDVLVVPGPSVWVDRGAGLQPVPVPLTASHARALAVGLISAGGRRLDDAEPCADVQLPGGLRVHAVLPPVAVGGVAVSIRVPSPAAPPLDGWRMAPGLRERLRAVLRERGNILISGATGAGKSTLLTGLLAEVPGDERLVVVEDVAELVIPHPHVVQLQTRPPNAEGRGEWTMAGLIRQALRMRPDRLVIGECRGEEVRDMLMALNTGHGGCATTIHANSVAAVAARLEALGMLAGLDPGVLATLAVSALHLVVHVRRTGGGREVAGAGVLRRDAGGRLEVRPLDGASDGGWRAP
jgi:pilus assembly protein CpaF